VEGATARDRETGAEFTIPAKCVINATGPFCDAVRRLADPNVKNLISPSQGIHLVFDRSFLAGDSAIMVPHTTDGRVMFAIPWHGHTLVGTTDTPISEPSEEPAALEEEISFVLENAQRYLHRAPTRSDILSVFTGIRPLVRGATGSTAALSRDHTIYIDQSGLLTITGGKWTTYRHMAEDCVNQAATLARLPDRACVTRTLRIHGHLSNGESGVYGSDAGPIADLSARTIEDVLARRTRALFLNAAAALAMAPRVGQLMAAELRWDDSQLSRKLDAFRAVASTYAPAGYNV
jgi:glycerol-3-phosphate dehydrogenase